MVSGPSRQWQDLAERAAAAFSAHDSDWGRYGLPEPCEAWVGLFPGAGGPEGALLRIRLACALPMIGEIEKPGEMELIPPRDSCFRVVGVRRGAKVSDWSERVWERTVVLLEQIQMRTVRGR